MKATININTNMVLKTTIQAKRTQNITKITKKRLISIAIAKKIIKKVNRVISMRTIIIAKKITDIITSRISSLKITAAITATRKEIIIIIRPIIQSSAVFPLMNSSKTNPNKPLTWPTHYTKKNKESYPKSKNSYNTHTKILIFTVKLKKNLRKNKKNFKKTSKLLRKSPPFQ